MIGVYAHIHTYKYIYLYIYKAIYSGRVSLGCLNANMFFRIDCDRPIILPRCASDLLLQLKFELRLILTYNIYTYIYTVQRKCVLYIYIYVYVYCEKVLNVLFL